MGLAPYLYSDEFCRTELVAVNFQGNPKYVIVQPALVTDPTAVPDPTKPLPWTQGGVIVDYLAR